MKGIPLETALSVAQRIKNGEAVAAVRIGDKEYFPRTRVYYLAGMSNAIENTNLVLSKNLPEAGVRNVDKNMLDFSFLATAARIRFDTTTALVTPQTGDYNDPAPVYWNNGSIKVLQNGLLSDLPVSVLANNYSATSNEDDFFDFCPYLIRPGQAFEINTALAGPAVANHAFRYEISGIEFVENKR